MRFIVFCTQSHLPLRMQRNVGTFDTLVFRRATPCLLKLNAAKVKMHTISIDLNDFTSFSVAKPWKITFIFEQIKYELKISVCFIRKSMKTVARTFELNRKEPSVFLDCSRRFSSKFRFGIYRRPLSALCHIELNKQSEQLCENTANKQKTCE